MPLNRLSKATVLSHKPAGRGYYRIVLNAPEIASGARPGQFVMLRVSENLDPLLARPFGISDVPAKSAIEILYRVVGKGTTMLTGRKVGEKLVVLGPLGRGFPLPDKGKTLVMVAGGSGFPPLHFLSQRVGCSSHLFLGSRDRECLPPTGILRNFRNSCTRVHIATEDGSMGSQGMTTDILNAFVTKLERKFNIVLCACGPHSMLAAVSRIANLHAIPCYVSMEERMACGLGVCMGCSIPMKGGGYKRACKEGPVFDAQEIDWSETVSLPFRQLRKQVNTSER